MIQITCEQSGEMTLKSRLSKLEGIEGGGKTVLVFVPQCWDAEMCEDAFERIVLEHDIEGPLPTP